MTAAEIAAALGSAHRSGKWWRCRCPSHGSHGATLALRDGELGLIVKCFAGCDPRDVFAALRSRGLMPGWVEHRTTPTLSRPATRHDDGPHQVKIARRIWNNTQGALGTPVVPYFKGRGIIVDLPTSLRWAPVLRCLDGTSGAAMIARIDNIDGQLIGIARTWLTRDSAGNWRRLDRAMLGRAYGGAVRLAPAAETLIVGEGIETCLAAMTATAMPAWAALSAAGLTALALPPIVRAVIILADHDRSGTGERAGRTAAARWLAEGRSVKLAMPPEPGTDFNDVLLGRFCSGVVEAHCAA